ncbi:MAG: class I SAM-dependent methyltransferase [Isosphaeraceae bacterium]
MNSSAISAWEGYVGQRFAELKSAFPDSISAYDPRVIAIQSARPSWQGLRVLDIGSGKGRYEEHFESWGADYVGIDLSARFLASGRRLNRRILGSGLHFSCRPFRSDW